MLSIDAFRAETVATWANAKLASYAPELLTELERLTERLTELEALCPGNAGMVNAARREALGLLERIKGD